MRTTLDEVCVSIADGDHQAPPKSAYGIPFITISCLDPNGGEPDFESAARVPLEYYESLADNRRAKVGDVLLSVVGSLGIPYLVKQDDQFVFQRHIAILRPGQDLLPEYLYYLLKSPDSFHYIDSVAQGAAQRTLTLTQLRGMEVDIPSLDEQRRRVSALKPYDNLIENNRRQITLLEEAAQRLYREWFVDLHFPEYEDIEIVGGAPIGWRRTTMTGVCEAIGGGTPSTKNPSYWEGGSIPWVTPSDVTGNIGLYLPETEKMITNEGLAHSSAKMLPAMTILMTSRASIGYFALCEKPVCTNQGFISCIPSIPHSLWWLLYELRSRVDEMKSISKGSTFLELSKTAFRAMPVVLPDQVTLSRFEKVAQALFSKTVLLRKQLDIAQEARDRLLPKLMSGEIEVEG